MARSTDAHPLFTQDRRSLGAFQLHGAPFLWNGRIAESQVYADNKPVYELLSEHVQLIAEDNRWLAY